MFFGSNTLVRVKADLVRTAALKCVDEINATRKKKRAARIAELMKPKLFGLIDGYTREAAEKRVDTGSPFTDWACDWQVAYGAGLARCKTLVKMAENSHDGLMLISVDDFSDLRL